MPGQLGGLLELEKKRALMEEKRPISSFFSFASPGRVLIEAVVEIGVAGHPGRLSHGQEGAQTGLEHEMQLKSCLKFDSASKHSCLIFLRKEVGGGDVHPIDGAGSAVAQAGAPHGLQQ